MLYNIWTPRKDCSCEVPDTYTFEQVPEFDIRDPNIIKVSLSYISFLTHNEQTNSVNVIH